MFKTETYATRRNTLRKKFKTGLILLPGNGESSMNYPGNPYSFRQDSTFLYYFGIDRPGITGVMDTDEGTDCLFGSEYTLDDIIWMGPQPTLKEEGAKSGVKSTYPLTELQNIMARAIKRGRTIHFLPQYRYSNNLRLSSWLGITSDRLKDYVSRELIQAVVSMREIKSADEIAQIEDACEIAYKMHTTAMRMCRPGLYERNIAGRIEGIAAEHGAGVSFRPIVSQNGETLHNHYYGNKLTEGRLLLIDAGAENKMNYCSDFTRTIPVDGKFTDKQRDVYDIVLAANQKAQELARPDVTYTEVHMAAMRVIAEGLQGLGLIKGSIDEAVANGAPALFMPHGLGHQMGLDVHDMEGLGEKFVGYDQMIERSTQFGLAALRMGKTLREGHVITVEPGIYFIPALVKKWKSEHINSAFINFQRVESYLDFGGIRLEDNIVITPKGNRQLGRHKTPITVRQVEETMQQDNEQ